MGIGPVFTWDVQMSTYLMFCYNMWDDDKGPGWYSFVFALEATSVEVVRNEFEQGVRDRLYRYSDNIGEDYHIVDINTFQIVEEGVTNLEWSDDGTYYKSANLVPNSGGKECV